MKKSYKINWLKQKGNIIRTTILFSIGLFTMLYFQVAFAGSPGEYAVTRADLAVESLFKQNQLSTEYNYYYTGRSNLPYAVIGIDPKYTLNSKFWHKIEFKNKIGKKINNLMPIRGGPVIYGRILNSGGNQIGLWFSEYRSTIVRFESNNKLKVFSPYRPNDNV